MLFNNETSTRVSERMLEKLIGDRMRSGADRSAIDEKIWTLFGEEWAVMFTDLSGFSRGVEKFGIIHFLQMIYEFNELFIPLIEDHNGIVLKTEGDSLLVVFRDPVDALKSAVEMEERLKTFNQGRAPEETILLCVGLGWGKVLKIGDSDVFGAEVNAASKLGEDTAKGYEILVTDQFRQRVESQVGWKFEPIAEIPPGAKAAHKVLY